jgi:hypothetical protein
MKKLTYFILALIFFNACNTKPELTKEAIQGDWTCFEYTMEGDKVDPGLRDATVKMIKETPHKFIGDTLILKTSQFTLGFSCVFQFNDKKIICTPIGFNDVSKTTYSVIDYSGDVLVLQESNPGIVSTTYLKRGKK